MYQGIEAVAVRDLTGQINYWMITLCADTTALNSKCKIKLRCKLHTLNETWKMSGYLATAFRVMRDNETLQKRTRFAVEQISRTLA